MAQGELIVTGTIDVSQFWPAGKSDADTTKVLVQVQPGAFRFRSDSNAPLQPTAVFDQATVKSKHGTKPCIDSNGRITVRLQGIDAPELHYRPEAALPKKQRSKTQHDTYLKLNEEYTQHFSATCTLELSAYLATTGANPLSCEVLARVDQPNEVFDSYGRFVGDIEITRQERKENVNQWLLRSGWAYPAFYSSMSVAEITAMTAASEAAYSAGLGVWAHLADYVGKNDGKFDWDMYYNNLDPTMSSGVDAGPIVVPKLFRRLSTWEVNKKCKMISGGFRSYLEGKQDFCFETEEFLAQGPTASTPHKLEEYLNSDQFFTVWPEQIVFQEDASQLSLPGGAQLAW